MTLEPIGATLSRNAGDSLYGTAVMWMEIHYAPFSDLLHTLRTGEPRCHALRAAGGTVHHVCRELEC